ncbi:aldo/keto reductase [Thiohalorhabdus sp. Cl-TMA]|uniref:Aldo/keto reductase n=1 Tax=Thiohalorhabdus methylotrophus TaxID=3242694 RepID=A0ABV4TTK5_9GAMM
MLGSTNRKELPELIPGSATHEATRTYAENSGLAEGHFSDYGKEALKLSSIGLGSDFGEPSDAVDEGYRQALARGLKGGLNVIEAGLSYRYGRSARAAGAAIRAAVESGVPREALFVVGKGGFLAFEDGPPDDLAAWFKEEILKKGLGAPDELAQGMHLLTPAYIAWQVEQTRRALGVETLDAFLIDQSEVHIPELQTKEDLNTRLQKVYAVLEMMVQAGKLRSYGLATWKSCRVATNDTLFQSLTSQVGVAEKAAGDPQSHHMRLVTMPYNVNMLEGFTRFNQATGQGNVASTVQAAYQLGLYFMATHTLMGGRLLEQQPPILRQAMGELASPAQRALQFARSTPGVGTAMVSMAREEHVAEALELGRTDPMPRKAFLKMFEQAEDDAEGAEEPAGG